MTVLVSETTLAIELPDADTRLVRRTTTQPYQGGAHVSHINRLITAASIRICRDPRGNSCLRDPGVR